jgi:Domain of unknown function (DUF6321)
MSKHDKPIAKTTKGKDRNFLPTEQGAGMTAKGRAEYNKKNNANLKAPAPHPKTEADAKRKASFCARMGAVAKEAKDGERAKAALKRWAC